jgi:hypothetical protein
VVEPSRGVVAELGGCAQRQRWGLHDSGNDTEDGWDGRWAPRCRGERQSDTVMVEPWRAIAAWSWWSAVVALGCARLDEWIRLRACDKRIQVFGCWTSRPTNGHRARKAASGTDALQEDIRYIDRPYNIGQREQ